MFKKTVISPILFTLSLAVVTPVFAAGADSTIHQVYEAAQAGRFSDAQSMMDKVLQDHPNSAKAHYVEAELLAKQGRLHDAQSELNTAQRLDPNLSFANPQKVRELQNLISGARPVTQQMQRMQPAYVQHSAELAPSNNGESSSPIVTILVIAGLIALFFFIVRMLSRRNTVVAGGGGYPATYGPGGGMPSYGPGVMGGQPSGGIGSGILGGLATGAAMGAGMVAGEELVHHFTDKNRQDVVYDNPPDNNSNVSNRPDDMGGTDFGVSDNSSWDSGGSSGSDDW